MKKIKTVMLLHDASPDRFLDVLSNFKSELESFKIFEIENRIIIHGTAVFVLQDKITALLSLGTFMYGIKFNKSLKFRFNINNYPNILSDILYKKEMWDEKNKI